MSYKTLALFGGIISTVGAVYCAVKIKKICEALEMSFEKVADSVNIDISDEVLETAVKKAVEKETEAAVHDAVKSAVNDIKNDIHSEIKKAVDKEYCNIKEKVSGEVAVQAADINISDLRKVVIEKAEKSISDKFDSDLDEVMKKFNRELDNVGKIYKSIADSMTK